MSDQPAQQQTPPGTEGELVPKADHGETSYTGSGRLDGKVATPRRSPTTRNRSAAGT
jgi:hypothetical protein